MKPVNFKDTSDYDYMKVLGVEGAFSSLRIEKDTLPEGFYKYSFRNGEGELYWQIASDVLVDHTGDFISKQPLELGPDNVRELSDADWGFTFKKFDFEDFFGQKRSLNCQIADATAKRDALAGSPKSKAPVKSNPLEHESH